MKCRCNSRCGYNACKCLFWVEFMGVCYRDGAPLVYVLGWDHFPS